jgi:hypothetical protein
MAVDPAKRAYGAQRLADRTAAVQTPFNVALPQTTIQNQDDAAAFLQRDPSAAAVMAGGNSADWIRHLRQNNVRTDGGSIGSDGSWRAESAAPLLKQFALGAGALATGGMLGPALLGGGAAAGGASAATGAAGAATGGGGMGFGSILGAIGGGGKLGAALGAVGNIAGALGKGRADGRAAEADYGLRRDQVAGQNAAANVNADSTRLRQAMLLSLLGGVQDVNITPPAHIADRMASVTGGMRPSAIQGKQEIVDTMRPRIMQALLSGQHMPGLTEAPQAGMFDKILSGLGTAGAFAGALSGANGIKASAGPPQAPVAGGGFMRGASFLPDEGRLGVIR